MQYLTTGDSHQRIKRDFNYNHKSKMEIEMLDFRVEICSYVALFIILLIVINPIMVSFFYNALPTNKNMEIEEFIGKVTSKGSDAEYIVTSDYIYIVETTKYDETIDHYAYKGKTSGYIPTAFTYGTGDKIKRYSDFISIEDEILKAIENEDQKTANELIENVKKKQPLSKYFDKTIRKYEDKHNSNEN